MITLLLITNRSVVVVGEVMMVKEEEGAWERILTICVKGKGGSLFLFLSLNCFESHALFGWW